MPLSDATHSTDVAVSWEQPGDLVTPGDIDMLDQDGHIVARVSARMQRLAHFKAAGSA